MKTKQDLFNFFNALKIAYKNYEHEPLFTVEQAAKIDQSIPGGHIKNLFLKDDNGQFWLLCAEAHAKIELKKVAQLLKAPKLRFADANLLMQLLGVLPGSVTPYALINDVNHKVRVIIDKSILAFDVINAHPLENNATTGMSIKDFKRFIAATDHIPEVLDLVEYILE